MVGFCRRRQKSLNHFAWIILPQERQQPWSHKLECVSLQQYHEHSYWLLRQKTERRYFFPESLRAKTGAFQSIKACVQFCLISTGVSERPALLTFMRQKNHWVGLKHRSLTWLNSMTVGSSLGKHAVLKRLQETFPGKFRKTFLEWGRMNN